jgi:hypothetical protein
VTSFQIAPVRKSIVVQATAEKAFDVFTAGIDRWWPKSHGIGTGPVIESVIEPFVGGRWYSRHADGVEAVVGHVLVWEPAQRFVCSWEINAEWKSDPRKVFASEVEVRFVPEGSSMTRVELEHRNFERMPAPGGEKMRDDVGRGWPKIMDLFADEISQGGRST